jgi:hypothetical protein
MATSEMLDLATQMYRKAAPKILPNAVPSMLVTGASLMFLTKFVLPGLFMTQDIGSTAVQYGEMVISLLIGFFVAVPLLVIGLAYASVLIVQTVQYEMTAEKDTPEPDAKLAANLTGKVAKLLLLILAWGFIPLMAAFVFMAIGSLMQARGAETMENFAAVIAFLGFAIAPFSGIYVIHRFSLAMPVMLIENASPKEAIKRSAHLLKSHRTAGTPLGFTCSLWLLLALIGLSFYFGFGLAIDLSGAVAWIASQSSLGIFREALEIMLEAIPLFVAVWILTPLWAAASSVLYYDRRVRVEAYDIHVLAQAVQITDTDSRSA